LQTDCPVGLTVVSAKSVGHDCATGQADDSIGASGFVIEVRHVHDRHRVATRQRRQQGNHAVPTDGINHGGRFVGDQ
jgi:hypothetical protein